MRTLPDKIISIPLVSGDVDVDERGYLTDPDNWTQEFAEHTARIEGITLTPRHADMTRFIRDYAEEHGIMPDARFALKFLGEPTGLTKPEAKKVMYGLFPYGYVKQACKIAGMKQPRAWSTG